MLLLSCKEVLSAFEWEEKKTHAREPVAWVLGDRGALIGASRSGHTDTGATEHATRHATERGVRQLHRYEVMDAAGGSQVAASGGYVPEIFFGWLFCASGFQLSVCSFEF